TVVNAASNKAGPISPGEIIAIGGTGVGPPTPLSMALDQNKNVSTSLGGVEVSIGGFKAPLLYVSNSQINAIVPYEVAGILTPFVEVKYSGLTSNAYAVAAAVTAPGLFTVDGSGMGPAAILNLDNSYNGPNNPAPKGGYVVLFVTGEGQTSPT